MSKLERQRALPRPPMFASTSETASIRRSAVTDETATMGGSRSETATIYPGDLSPPVASRAASKPRKAKEARTIELGSPESDDLAHSLIQAARVMPTVIDPAAPREPFDYARTLDRLGLTHKAAADRFGMSRQSSMQWAKPDASIPAWLPRMLALIEATGLDTATRILAAVPVEA